MSAKRKSFSIERLESREMKAGDVAANLVNGELFLTEAAGQGGYDNSVMISQLANGKIRVAGNGSLSDGTMSLINGQAFQDFTVTGGLHVNFGGGNDLVVMGADPTLGPGGPLPSFASVDINMAAPPPVIAQSKVAAGLVGGAVTPFQVPDKDDVIIWGMDVRGTTKITTGDDDDWVYVANSKLGDNVGVDDVTINTGAGADTAMVKNVQGVINGKLDIQTYYNANEADRDVVWLDAAYARNNFNIRTGAGDDLIHLNNASTFQDLNIDAGAGNDTAELSNVGAVQNFFANMGAGNDTLNLTSVYTYNGTTTLDGGAGTDRLNKSGVTPTQKLTQTGWEWINGLPILTVAETVGAKPVMARA